MDLPFPSLSCSFLFLKMLFINLRESKEGRETLVCCPLVDPPWLFLILALPGLNLQPWCMETTPPRGAIWPRLPEAS